MSKSFDAIRVTFKGGRTSILPITNLEAIMVQCRKFMPGLQSVERGEAKEYEENGINKEAFNRTEMIWQTAASAAMGTANQALEIAKQKDQENEYLAQQNAELLKQLEALKAKVNGSAKAPAAPAAEAGSADAGNAAEAAMNNLAAFTDKSAAKPAAKPAPKATGKK